jgi:TIR domain
VPRVFISASAEDRPFVERLKRDLAAAGVETDTADFIQPGESIANGVTQGIERADNVIAVISNSSAKSSWVSTEIALALAQQQRDGHTRLLPVLADANAPQPMFLRDLLYLDMSSRERCESAIPRLISSITHPPKNVEDKALILKRRSDTLTIGREALENAKREHAEHLADRSEFYVSAMAGSAAVIVAVAALIFAFRSQNNWHDNFEIIGVVTTLASLASGFLSNFFYRRLQKRHEVREALDE